MCPIHSKNPHCTLAALEHQFAFLPSTVPDHLSYSIQATTLFFPSLSYSITLGLSHTDTFLPVLLYKLLFLIHFFLIISQIIDCCLHTSFPVQQSIVYHRQCHSCRSAFEDSDKRTIFVSLLPMIFKS